jgi:cell division protein FtsW (lipid II flippase)
MLLANEEGGWVGGMITIYTVTLLIVRLFNQTASTAEVN